MADVKIDTNIVPELSEINDMFNDITESAKRASSSINKLNKNFTLTGAKEVGNDLDEVLKKTESFYDYVENMPNSIKVKLDFKGLEKTYDTVVGMTKTLSNLVEKKKRSNPGLTSSFKSALDLSDVVEQYKRIGKTAKLQKSIFKDFENTATLGFKKEEEDSIRGYSDSIEELLNNLEKMQGNGKVFKDDWTKALNNVNDLLGVFKKNLEGITDTTLKDDYAEILSQLESRLGQVTSKKLKFKKGSEEEYNEKLRQKEEKKSPVRKVRESTKGIKSDLKSYTKEYKDLVKNFDLGGAEKLGINLNKELEKFEALYDYIEKLPKDFQVRVDFKGIDKQYKKLISLAEKTKKLTEESYNPTDFSRGYVPPSEYQRVSGISENAGKIASEQRKIFKGMHSDVLKDFVTGNKDAWNKVGDFTKTVIDKYWSLEKNAIGKTFSLYKSLFKGIGTTINKTWSVFHKNGNSTIDALKRQLGTLVGYFSIYQLFNTGKDAITFSSDMIEVRNVIQGVFRDSSSEIQDFAKTAISSFGLTELQATKMTGVFGGILTSSGVASDSVALMSKNLTALAGDIASFYNLTQDESFKKLTSAITGETEAIRSLGVNMTVANLEAYALTQGITEQWRNLDYATQQTLRYNYIMQQLAVIQGDFARTSGTWANQVRLLSSNWQQFLSIVGGAAIQVFYPVVVVLNQILSLAIQAGKAMASIFGFDYASLESQFGTGASLDTSQMSDLDTEVDTGGIEDYTDATSDATTATDDLAKATEEAGENLQSFDRLNNITTDDIEARTEALKDSAKGDSSDKGKSGFNIEPFDYLGKVKNPSIEVNKWLEDWINTLKDKRWFEAGEKLADLIADGLDEVYDEISSDEFKKKTKDFATGLVQFINGFTKDAHLFNSAGKTLGAGVNTVTTFLNTFFDEVDWNTMGKNTNQGIKSFLQELDATELGKSIVNPFYAAIQFLEGFVSDPTIFDTIGTELGEGINGAIERIDLAKSIPVLTGFLGGLIKTLGTTASTIDWTALSDGLQTGLDTAIDNWKPEETGTAIASVVNGLAKLLQGVANADWSEAGDKLGETINTALDEGAVENMVSSMATIALKLLTMLGNAIVTVDKGKLISQIINGLKDAFNQMDEEDMEGLTPILAVFFTGLLGKGIIKGVKGVKLGAEFISTIKSLFTGKGVSSGIETAMSGTTKTGILGGIKSAVAGISGTQVASLLAPIVTLIGGSIAFITSTSEYRNAPKEFEDIKNKYKEMLSSGEELDLGLSFSDNATSIAYNMETFLSNANELVKAYTEIDKVITSAGSNTDFITGKLQDASVSVEEFYEAGKKYRKELEKYGYTELDSYKELTKVLSSYDRDMGIVDSGKFKEDISNALRNVVAEVEGGRDAVKGLADVDFSEATNKVDNYILSLAEKGKEGGKSLKQGVDQGISETTTEDGCALDSMLGGTTEELTADGVAKGSAFAQGVMQGITEATAETANIFDQVLPNSIEDFSSKGIDCAVEFVHSIMVSIEATQSSVDASVSTLASNMYTDNVHRFVLAGQQLAEAFNSTLSSTIDTSKVTTRRGSGNIITRGNTLYGTRTGNIGGTFSSYSLASEYARTMPSTESLTVDTGKFARYYSEPATYASNSVSRNFVPTNSLITPSQYASNTQASKSLSLDPELMNLLRGMSTRLNALRNTGGSNVDVSVSLGNKQFDNYILDVVRRNGYRKNN